MTIYVVMHGDTDYRLHRYRDGTHTELYQFTMSDWPEPADLVDGLAEAHNGASILGDPEARRDLIELVMGERRNRQARNVPW